MAQYGAYDDHIFREFGPRGPDDCDFSRWADPSDGDVAPHSGPERHVIPDAPLIEQGVYSRTRSRTRSRARPFARGNY